MASKTTETAPEPSPMNALAQLEKAGFGSMMGMSTAWLEALSDMSAEMTSFVAERIREDVKTQHEMLHCKDIASLQHIQAEFVQKAIDQYQRETGKLVEMTTSAFAPKKNGDKK